MPQVSRTRQEAGRTAPSQEEVGERGDSASLPSAPPMQEVTAHFETECVVCLEYTVSLFKIHVVRTVCYTFKPTFYEEVGKGTRGSGFFFNHETSIPALLFYCETGIPSKTQFQLLGFNMSKS